MAVHYLFGSKAVTSSDLLPRPPAEYTLDLLASLQTYCLLFSSVGLKLFCVLPTTCQRSNGKEWVLQTLDSPDTAVSDFLGLAMQ